MFTNAKLATTRARTSESQVFVPLEIGIPPFPLKRTTVHVPVRFAKPTYELVEEKELATPLVHKPVLRLATASARLTKVFRRRPVVNATPTTVNNPEPIWFTSPDNWRPGLLSLEQAVHRAEIVRRPEAFERV